MPIKGLTDRNLSFPELGQIRKGAPKTENKPGKDLQFFRVEFDEREEKAKQIFLSKYGAQPTEINILLPFNEIWRCWDSWYEAYTAGRMVARSDGERFIYLVDVKTGQLSVKDGEPYTEHREIVGTYTNSNNKRQEQIKCKPVGRLKVVIPELGRMAYLTVTTTSIHDIGNLSAQLEGFKAINGGRIAGIPLILRRRPKKISVPKPDGSRVRMTKWMLSIEADPEWVKRMLENLNRAALPEGGAALLPAGPEAEEETAEYEEVAEDDADEDESWIPGEDEPPMPEDDYLEGELEDPAPPPPPANGNGNGNGKSKFVRPFSPDQLREAIEKKAASYGERQASDKQQGLLAHVLNEIFQDESKRHNFQAHILGNGSLKKVSGAMVQACLDWLKVTQDSGGMYVPDPMSVREAHAAWEDFQVASGQETLF